MKMEVFGGVSWGAVMLFSGDGPVMVTLVCACFTF